MVDSRAARLAIRVHHAVLRLSGGRLGSRLGHLEQVLLTTTGRRTGRPRTTPLAVTPVDGDRLVLVASDGGADRDPGWYRNLAAQPDVVVRRGTVDHRYRARTTSGAERERLWRAAVANHAGYAAYQSRTTRQIPVVLLEPRD